MVNKRRKALEQNNFIQNFQLWRCIVGYKVGIHAHGQSILTQTTNKSTENTVLMFFESTIRLMLFFHHLNV